MASKKIVDSLWGARQTEWANERIIVADVLSAMCEKWIRGNPRQSSALS